MNTTSTTDNQSEKMSDAMASTCSGEGKKSQYCRVLRQSRARKAEQRKAWKVLQQSMPLVPGGSILVRSWSQPADHDSRESELHNRLVQVDGFYLDRMAVSNHDFARFVKAGGYNDLNLWPNQVWPFMVQMVDQTGISGPKYWNEGRPDKNALNHPVVGVSWYEAFAFANWVGKSLPESSQWQRACTWGATTEGRRDSARYPWGNMFENRFANTWSSGIGETVEVDQYGDGCTPNGIHQLIGNTWEWTNSPFVYPDANEIELAEMAEIRGGAFDTYFTDQATSQFRSGLPRLFRGLNTGFRCCIAVNEIRYQPNA